VNVDRPPAQPGESAPGLRQLPVQLTALPGHQQAAPDQQREAQLDQFGQRTDRACDDHVPALAVHILSCQ